MSQPELLVRRYYEQALSRADWVTLDAIVAPDYIDHEVVPNLPPTRDGLKQKYELLRSGCPDLRFVVADLMSVGDRVAVRLTVHGTHSRPFLGRPPTNRHMTTTKMSMFRVAGDQLVEHWGVFDQLTMLAQLGALPAMTSK